MAVKLLFYLECTYIIVVSLMCISQASYQSHVKLRKALLSPERYDPLVRPVKNTTDPVMFELRMNYNDVEIQENQQTITMTVWMVTIWKDDFLTWNSTEYDGVDKIDITPTGIWKPYFSILRSFESSEIHIHEDTLFNVESTGLVKLQMGYVAKIVCEMDIMKFPFDTQTCEFFIIGTYMASNEMKFHKVRFNNANPVASQWVVISSTAKIGTRFTKSVVDFTITAKRLPELYIIKIIAPLVVTALLNPMVLLIPPSSGELASVAITILLSYTVFLNILSDILPKTSSSISVLSVYIMLLQGLSAVYTIIGIMLVKRDTSKQNNETWFACLWKICFFGSRKKSKIMPKETEISEKDNQPRNFEWFILCFMLSFTLTTICFALILS